jgi:hypothetical protein
VPPPEDHSVCLLVEPQGLTCGYDHLTLVPPAYQRSFRYTGTIHRVVVDVSADAGPMPPQWLRD